ncbi:nitrate reductase molybdenum cofactor assembly chaperone [Ammoniphilus resinae]|uniref:Nitrate reductase delta subunit n=1 Tax=Ammoniphilus resinae TaxID=861532 RepID=A0ABS4GTI3_9BACL|nr:nitrate reductase molybdenum cofactor assembly chaperone [Ammoniphilus resinae]MBP1933569.1 nitrate reductase delta subunit [Ammoniphilus resinae]
MTEEKATMLLIVSRILDYPNADFHAGRSSLIASIKESVADLALRKEMVKRIIPLYKMKTRDLQELYVETFDHQEKTSLYLTAHELGDSRKRGLALIELQNLILDTGFVPVGKELIDYIPRLLELLAVASESDALSRLEKRLAFAIHRIVNHLPHSNSYRNVLELLSKDVFAAPLEDEMEQLAFEREEADLDPLPYPMLYQ